MAFWRLSGIAIVQIHATVRKRVPTKFVDMKASTSFISAACICFFDFDCIPHIRLCEDSGQDDEDEDGHSHVRFVDEVSESASHLGRRA